MQSKRDLSISMAQASAIVLLVSIPLVILQFAVFFWLHGSEGLKPIWGTALLVIVILLGIVIHELIHGITWMILGHKSLTSIRFGVLWQTLTPYAHLTEPVNVIAYRMGAFMPGFLLGILPYALSLILGNGDLFWFSLIHTSAAGGDWLVLWLLRNVSPGLQVEDHPTNAGCYVIEP